jgi:SAM-dependent methyltransferase
MPAALERRYYRSRARHLASGMVPGAVLDVGCGQGQILAELRVLGWRVLGVEISPEAAEAVRRAGIPVAVGPLESHHFEDGAFDLVLFDRVLEHVERPREVLREAHRILRPGGRLVAVVPNFGPLQQSLFGARWMHLDPSFGRVYFDERSLEHLLEETHFMPEEVRHFSLEMGPFTWVQSLENLALGEGNLLHRTLHGGLRRGVRERFRQAVAYVGGVLLTPAAMAAAALAAATGNGDVIEVVASRR